MRIFLPKFWFRKICTLKWKSVLLVLLLTQLLPKEGVAQEEIQITSYNVNYTFKDGLPSSEVHEVFQDRQRNLWFCTSTGISKFNGDEFENYLFPDQLRSNIITYGLEDNQGKLWFCNFQHEIFTLSPEEHTIKKYSFNSKLDDLLKQSPISKFRVDGDTLWFFNRTSLNGKIVFDPDLDSTLAFEHHIQSEPFYIKVHRDSILTYGAHSHKFTDYFRKQIGGGEGINYQEGYSITEIIPFQDGYLATSGKLLLYFNKDLELVSHGVTNYNFSGTIFPISEDWFWASTIADGAILYQFNGTFHQKQQVLKGKYVSGICGDDEGGMWMATPYNGVFYFPEVEIYQIRNATTLQPVKIHATLATSDRAFLSLYAPKSLFQILWKDSLEIRKEVTSKSLIVLSFYDSVKQSLFLHSPSKFKTLGDGDSQKYVGVGGIASFLDSANRSFTLSNAYDKIMLRDSSRNETKVGNLENISRLIKMVPLNQHQFYVVGRQWCFIYDHRHRSIIEINRNSIPEIGRINHAIAVSDSILLASERHGLIWIDSTQSYLIQPINPANALQNWLALCAVPGEKGNYFAGTSLGLIKIAIENNRYRILERYGRETGFPFTTVLKLEQFGDRLIVGCESESFILKIDKLKTQKTHHLKLDQVLADDAPLERSEDGSYIFGPETVNITLKFHNQTFRNYGNHHYRYRIADLSDSWTYTDQNSIVLTGLAFGEYQLLLETNDMNGSWTGIAPIQINLLPPFYREIWFIALCLLVFFGLSAWLVYWRINQIRHTSRLRSAVTAATNKSLAAQLNPHFLFNVLNTVGSNIVHNKLAQSMDTISKFAKLMRMVFTNSESDFISLEDELNALEAYVALEQLRLKEKLEFNIVVDPTLQPKDLLIPPLLLQPLVENAIWHGSPPTGEKGYVELAVSSKGKDIWFEIKDNGSGFEDKKKSIRIESKISSLQLIAKRFQLLNELSGQKLLLHHEEAKEDGFSTVVRLIIPRNMKDS